jgi:hypothetical protein
MKMKVTTKLYPLMQTVLRSDITQSKKEQSMHTEIHVTIQTNCSYNI